MDNLPDYESGDLSSTLSVATILRVRERKPGWNREYSNRWYAGNSEKHRADVAARKAILREWLREYKSRLRCCRCGEARTPTLDFHHRDRRQKALNISQAVSNGWSIERIKVEIAKCDVLCANCHRVEEAS